MTTTEQDKKKKRAADWRNFYITEIFFETFGVVLDVVLEFLDRDNHHHH